MKDNNISPQTMTTITASASSSSSSSSSSTCSDLQQRKTAPNGPLFDTGLLHLNQLTDDENQYKNEIYRNSHLIISKQQQQHSSLKLSSNNFSLDKSNACFLADINIYEAKPVHLLNNPDTLTTNAASNCNQQQQISCV